MSLWFRKKKETTIIRANQSIITKKEKKKKKFKMRHQTNPARNTRSNQNRRIQGQTLK